MSTLFRAIKLSEDFTEPPESMTVMALTIGNVRDSPFDVNKIAALSHDNSTYIKLNRPGQGRWTCVIKSRDSCEPVITSLDDTKAALEQLMEFLSGVVDSRAEDLHLAFHAGVRYSLPILMHLCAVLRVQVPNFPYLDTLPLAFFDSIEQGSTHELQHRFLADFPLHADVPACDEYGRNPFHKCCMTLMCLWFLLSSPGQSSAKLLKDVDFTPEVMRRIKVLSVMSLSEFQAKFLGACVACVEREWGVTAPKRE